MPLMIRRASLQWSAWRVDTFVVPDHDRARQRSARYTGDGILSGVGDQPDNLPRLGVAKAPPGSLPSAACFGEKLGSASVAICCFSRSRPSSAEPFGRINIEYLFIAIAFIFRLSLFQ